MKSYKFDMIDIADKPQLQPLYLDAQATTPMVRNIFSL